MNLRTTSAAILASASLALTTTGGEVRFLDTTGDHDLANAANWEPSSWTAGDTLLVSTATATIPTTGLHLSADMPASTSLKFGAFPNENVMIDFGGHSLNTDNLVFGNMHNDNNRFKYLLASGGFSGVKNLLLNEEHRGHVRFTNGTFRVKNSLRMDGRWYPYVHVLAGAELVIENVVADQSVGMNGTQRGEFRVSGGKFVVQRRESEMWRRSYWNGESSPFTVEKGGEYRDDSRFPANSYRGVAFTIRDAGYYETNSAVRSRNTGFFATQKYEITNSVFRVAQLYCGPYQISGAYYNDVSYALSGSTVDFCDSEETFAFAPDPSHTTAGVIVPPSAANNTIKFRGGKNRFTSQTFVLGGSNAVAVTGGRFEVSNSFDLVTAQTGKGSRLLLKDADVYLGTLTASASATNTLVEICGAAKVRGRGDFAAGGPDSAMRVTDDAVVDIGAHRFSLKADGSDLYLGGLASTGTVSFTAENCTATLAGTMNGTVLGAGWSRMPPVWFEAGKANNVLVISNATYDCHGPAWKSTIRPNVGLGYEARPFTECPGCRIEFRGSSPAFTVSDTKEAESSGNSWFSMAFGEMIDREANIYTQESYPLDNPVRLRFVLPPSTNSYVQAPVRSERGIIVLGGNAEFEFDMSEYDWPQGRFSFPLVWNGKGFRDTKDGISYYTYIDVEQLNETNARRMPVDKYGHRAGKFELSADGKTLCLVVKKTDATVFILR